MPPIRRVRRATGPNPNPRTQGARNWGAGDIEKLDRYLGRYTQKAQDSECELWMKSTTAAGYGRARFQLVQYHAHVLAYLYKHAHVTMQRGMRVAQTCGHKLCVTPAHLELRQGGATCYADVAEDAEPTQDEGQLTLPLAVADADEH